MKKTKIPELSFKKMTGAGNDFLIIDARDVQFPKLNRVEMVKKICERHFGVGADGVFFIETSDLKDVHFKWDFYNADGSKAEMCGNGARCVARFAKDNQIAPDEMKFETVAGVIGAKIKKDSVEIQMTRPKVIFKSVDVVLGDHFKVNVSYWDTGVPHVVKQTEDWSDEYLNDMGEALRNHDFFKKTNGANVTFFEIVGPSHIQAVTYERGVEGVTLACGTGAVAAAAQAFLLGEKCPIEVTMPGGTMKVDLGSELEWATLTGPAHYICSGQLSEEILDQES